MPASLLADIRRIREQDAEIERLKSACSKQDDAICQTLGKALGYPRYSDDQKNFPGATEANGVCVGNHVAESLADEAASEIRRLRALCGEAADRIRSFVVADEVDHPEKLPDEAAVELCYHLRWASKGREQ